MSVACVCTLCIVCVCVCVCVCVHVGITGELGEGREGGQVTLNPNDEIIM